MASHLAFSSVLYLLPFVHAACGESPRVERVPDASLVEQTEARQTFVFDCSDPNGEGFTFTVQTRPGEAALWLPYRFGGRYLVLGQVRSASGARYEGDGVVYWKKGDEALLEVEGARFEGCMHNRQRSVWEHAKLSGVDFRAVGQEPGWLLEIRNYVRIRFVSDYGEREVTTPAPEPTVEQQARRTVYHAETEAHDLRVKIVYTPCVDTMSGESFATSVTVDLDGETFRGCGRALH